MENATYYAIAVVNGTDPASGNPITGQVKFIQNFGQLVQYQVNINGLPAGMHGFHIHEFGDLSGGCATAGAHYNPNGVNHGGPTAATRHVGDLGNINVTAVSGATLYKNTDHLINIYGDLNNIVGRSVIIHQDQDDLGLGGQSDSLTTGHAGARVCCGVIGASGPFAFD